MKKNNEDLREIKFTLDYTKHAEGSVLVEFGDTKVICTASIEDKVPPFLKNTGSGWISAEYSMLPRSTHQRKMRESTRGKVDGRTHEIQRLIGRSLRSVVDLKALGEKTIWVDCDVIQADGGTRTASITGAYVALTLACYRGFKGKTIKKFPVKEFVSAVSVGIVKDQVVLDLCYEEDSNAHVDMNVVMTGRGEFIELQSTGEEKPFSRVQFNQLLDAAEKGCNIIMEKQMSILGQDIVDEVYMKPKEPVKKPEKLPQDNSNYMDKDGDIQIVLASSNPYKIQEISKIFKFQGIKLLSLEDVNLKGLEIEETGTTFEENALIKAKEVMNRTGMIAIADDSGLMVDVLDGEPGVYSARYSGEKATYDENNKLLLKNLKNTTKENRNGKFVTVIAITFPDGREGIFKGICQGQIGFEEKGTNGFGYDPLFIPMGEERTFAEITEEEKNRISHRARALKVMSKKIRNILY